MIFVNYTKHVGVLGSITVCKCVYTKVTKQDYLGGGISGYHWKVHPYPKSLVSDASRNSLRGCKFKNFPGGACPQTPLVNSVSFL